MDIIEGPARLPLISRATKPPVWIELPSEAKIGNEPLGNRAPLLVMEHDPDTEERIDPLADPSGYATLGLELANLELTQDAISRFVMRFGYLNQEPVEVLYQVHRTDPESITRVRFKAETFRDWDIALTVFRAAWAAWRGDGVSEGEELSIRMRKEGRCDWHVAKNGIPFPVPGSSPISAGPGDGWANSIVIPDETYPQAYVLNDLISRYTRRYVTVELSRSKEGRDFIAYRPVGILGLAWLQLAEDVVGGEPVRYGVCPECGIRYVIKREDQRTCGSSTCRGRAHSRRCKRARALSDEGKTDSQVAILMAHELSEPVSEKQVTQWVKTSRKRRKGSPRPRERR